MKNFLLIFWFGLLSLMAIDMPAAEQISSSRVIQTETDTLLIKKDANGNSYALTFDTEGHIIAIEQKNPANQKLSAQQLRYDAQGNKIAEMHEIIGRPSSVATYEVAWEFNANQQLTSITEGTGSHEPRHTKYFYDASGTLTELTKPDGMQLHMSYIADGKISELSSADMSICYSYIYDEHGHVIEAIDHNSNSITKRTYDQAGRLLAETLGNGLTLTHAYEDNYDKIVLPDDSAIQYIYDQHALASIVRLTSDGQERYRCPQIAHAPLIENALEALLLEKEAFKDKKLKQVYTYDTRGQIIAEKGHTDCCYSYDSLKNRIMQNGENWEIDDHNQLLNTTNASFTWDQNGNCLSKTNRHTRDTICYSYDALNRLIAVTLPTQKSIHFTYDPFHRRLSKICLLWDSSQNVWIETETVSYLYDGEKEIGAFDNQGNMLQLRLLKKGFSDIGAAVALEIGARTFQPIHDTSGSIIALVDFVTGDLQEYYCYSAFGDMQIFDASGQPHDFSPYGNPWLYFSKRLDTEIELSFFGMRYYSASMGRWLSADPLGFIDGINRFVFMHNDPVHYTDLYGLFSIKDMWEPGTHFLSALYDTVANYCHTFRQTLSLEDRLTEDLAKSTDTEGFGSYFKRLIGLHQEHAEAGFVGHYELDDKVRITFVNGILNLKEDLLNSAQMISDSHGGTRVHYIFRPTLGWSWDMLKSIFVKAGYVFSETKLLAATWKKLIDEMGGINSGGCILHYAHSIGSADTFTAKSLLSADEQKMIKVVTFGSPTLQPSEGFQSVAHYISVRDGVPLLDMGNRLSAFFKGEDHIIPVGNYFGIPFVDHLLNSDTYRGIIETLGQEFYEKATLLQNL